MIPRRCFILFLALLHCIWVGSIAEARELHGHLPPAGARSQELGPVAETNVLRLALTLPLRNTETLSNLLQQIYDPNSTNYHRYLSSEAFTAQFGPSQNDYAAVQAFAASNGFTLRAARGSQLIVDIEGPPSVTEHAFHIHLRQYQHPTETRVFVAPLEEPSIDDALPIAHVHGLETFTRPHAMAHPVPAGAGPAGGSQASGNYIGKDFRNAYAPKVNLTGAGQMVGLLEFDGFYPVDITNYEITAGYTPVPLQVVNSLNAPSAPFPSSDEVSLDIETALSMAPGLSAVVVFEAGIGTGTSGWIDILDDMASSNQIKQFSSSWGYLGTPDPATDFDTQFMRMAAQGQSFFQASGDGDAWTNTIWVPADSPYLTSVGGTKLSMAGAGLVYSSETVWNTGNLGSNNAWSLAGNGYWGSGGGVSTIYSIPSWQVGLATSSNHLSTTMRNIPDVALTATGIWVVYGNGASSAYMGTSCAAPLWAGYMALVNQQAAAAGYATTGFLNPAIYAIGTNAAVYTTAFHDITSGNNANASSGGLYPAQPKFDLCTGWGTPTAGLINALAPEPFATTPNVGFLASGSYGGPFSGASTMFVLTNGAGTSLPWTVILTNTWLSASATSGTLTPFSATTVTIGVNAAANQLAVGSYLVDAVFSNLNDGSTLARQFLFSVNKSTPTVVWSNAVISYGTVLDNSTLDATTSVTGAFVYTPAAGTLLTAGANSVTAIFTPADTTNYTKATNSITVTVLPVLPITTWQASAPIVYGTPLDATILDASALIPGLFTYTPPVGTILPPGTNTLTAVFKPTDALDFLSITNTINLTVTLVPIPLSIQSTGATTTLTWNDPAGAFALQGSPTVNGAFTNIPLATSPFISSPTNAAQFFRLQAQ